MRDLITLGFSSGFIGNFVKGFMNVFTGKKKRSKMLFSHLAGSIFKPRRTKKRGPLLLGSLADLATGTLLGVPLVYFMKKTGRDNYMLKGASYGGLIWILLYGLGYNHELFKPRKTRSTLNTFIEHIILGVVTAHVAVKLADPGTFPDDEFDF